MDAWTATPFGIAMEKALVAVRNDDDILGGDGGKQI